MAKDLVRTRRYCKKFMLMKANIQAVSLKIQTLRSQNAMAQAMKGVTRAMQSMNRQLNMPQIQRILQEFEKQSEIMDMKEEMMNDAIDDAMEDDADEEETYVHLINFKFLLTSGVSLLGTLSFLKFWTSWVCSWTISYPDCRRRRVPSRQREVKFLKRRRQAPADRVSPTPMRICKRGSITYEGNSQCFYLYTIITLDF